mmetsp:Transcript_7168/g.10663  ORF Transcript_7168/g.10663 Transcript_7168/m.10663 type:complete len:311 (+) Transcript_7168:437-1369(+)
MLVSVSLSLTLLISVCGLPSPPYECIFGYSTGHVGTTTLSRPSSYLPTSSTVFLFEGHRIASSIRAASSTVSYRKYTALNFTVQHELEFILYHALPFYQRAVNESHAEVVMDLGHANLFYYRGIAEAVKRRAQGFCTHVTFVRIRRARYESAKSLMYTTPGRLRHNLCTDVLYGYCPFHNIPAVVLNPPNRSVWQKFTVFQQALWLIDETEARWRQLVCKYSSVEDISFVSLYWSSKIPGSLERSIERVARLIQGSPNHGTAKRTQVHSNNTPQGSDNSVQQDMAYREAMGYSETPFIIEDSELFSSVRS